jgi:hypothetical protein
VPLTDLDAGLWRWTAIHPDAEDDPAPGSPADWPADVGSVAYVTGDTLILIDPLVPDDLWPELEKRYGASTSRARQNLPSNVIPIPLRRAGETIFWLPDVRTLVPGDRLLGGANGGLRVCPDSWLRYLTSRLTGAELRVILHPLLDLPIERVLTSHGEPVLSHGREALARALG